MTTFELHLDLSGTGSGSVTRNPPNLASNASCTAVYRAGSVVSLTATHAENSTFEGWSGDCCGDESSCTITMDSAKSIVANFSLNDEKVARIGYFIDHGDGTVTDTRTGLMWMRFAVGQQWSAGGCTGEAERLTMDHAKAIRRSFAGHVDWRLPTLEELESIVDSTSNNPALDTLAFHGFEKTSDPLYWSSKHGWYVSFYSGSSFLSDSSARHSVRLVRNVFNSGEISHGAETHILATGSASIATAVESDTKQKKFPSPTPNDAVKDLTHNFIDNCDGTVTDPRTRLMWIRFAEGQRWFNGDCTGEAQRFTRNHAKAIRREFAGHGDWRLPTVEELISIVDASRVNPACNPLVFLGFEKTPYPLFWTSDSDILYISLYSGRSFICAPEAILSVRLVRSLTLSEKKCLERKTAIAVIQKTEIMPAVEAELDDVKFHFLLREIAHTEKPSASLINALSNKPQLILRSGGKFNRTFLHHAAGNKKLEIVKFLCAQSFANVNSLDQDGYTPLDYALTAKAVAVVDYLRSMGASNRFQLRRPLHEKLSQEVLLQIETKPCNSTVLPQPVTVPSSLSAATASTTKTTAYMKNVQPSPTVLVQIETKPTKQMSQSRGYIATAADTFSLRTSTSGSGLGTITFDPAKNFHTGGTTVKLTAQPNLGSLFTGWSGDIIKIESIIFLVMDADKQITANFEVKTFVLCIKQSGNGAGTVTRNPSQDAASSETGEYYPAGTPVTLTASPLADSTFVGWCGDSVSADEIISILMDKEKSVSAMFLLKSFGLSLTQDGLGSGIVTSTPEGHSHIIGSVVSLAAIPASGSVFSGWSGDITEKAPTCTVVMNSEMSITANFSPLSLVLDVSTTGSGSGTITRSIQAESYAYDTTVSLKACAGDDSVFDGWSGDVSGLDATCTIRMDSAKSVTAEFMRIEIPDFGIGLLFDSAEHVSMKSGEPAFIIYVSIVNKGGKQVHAELPFARYVTCKGEEIEQDFWLSGLINGAQGATIRAGAFRKVGLVFLKSKLSQVCTGDHLYVTVSLPKSSRCVDFSLRCTEHVSRIFKLISATVAEGQAPEDSIANSLVTEEILRRIEVLEAGFSEVLCKLEALQFPLPGLGSNAANGDVSVQSLPQVLAWLAMQNRISLPALRSHLLPLDLLPSSFLDEINEQALNLTGDIALEEIGNEIVVLREVLAAVIANLSGS